MSILFKSASSILSNTISIPTHEENDFILAVAFGNSSTPSLPSGQNWTLRSSGSGVLTSYAIFWKFAQNSSELFGTSNNADGVLVNVYRGIDPIVPLGAGSSVYNPLFGSSNWEVPEINLQVTDNSSWVFGFAYTESGSPTLNPVSGTIDRTTGTRIISVDTDSGVSSWNTQTSNLGSSFSVLSGSIELREQKYTNLGMLTLM